MQKTNHREVDNLAHQVHLLEEDQDLRTMAEEKDVMNLQAVPEAKTEKEEDLPERDKTTVQGTTIEDNRTD